MARLITSGFELNSATAGVEIHQTNGVIVIGTGASVRSGTYALHTTGLVSGTSQRASFRHVSTPTGGPFWGRGYLNITTKPANDNSIMRLEATGVPIRVVLTTTGALKLIDEVGTIGTSAGTLNTATQYRIEVLLDSTGGAGHHIATLRVDGVDVVTSSTRTFTNPTIQQY